jgi:hypothetical protein
MKRVKRKAKGRQRIRGTAEFDREFVADTFAQASPAERARFERARRKPGRPKSGQGAHVISVSVERALLARTDELAKELGITRAHLIARGLKAVLAAEGRI